MMKTRLSGIGLVLIVCAAALGCVTTYPYHENVSMGSQAPPAVEPPGGYDEPFYNDLAPYGHWVYVSGPGWVWSPASVQVDWRPYSLGHWVFTDYGWTWSSDEPWGWAVYHYGRWHQDASYGWVWVPGTEWGPAWVAWHEGGGYVGWAPLPWQVSVRAGVALDVASLSVSIAPTAWCFTNTRYLVDPGLRTRIVPRGQNVTLIQVTRNVTNYTYIDNRVVNQGVQVEKVGRAVGHTIPHYRVSEAAENDSTRGGRVRGSDFVVFRHDPPRGRNSEGRTDPPGHDEDRFRGRDSRFRDSRQDDGRRGPTPPAQQTPPSGPSGPDAPPPQPPPDTSTPQRGHEQDNRGRDQHPTRGRDPQRDAPQGSSPQTPPAPPAAPGQPSAPAGQPNAAPPAPPAPPSASTPPAGNPHGANPPPAKVEPNDKGNASREGASRGKKPNPNAAKHDNSKKDDKDKDKDKDKPDSKP